MSAQQQTADQQTGKVISLEGALDERPKKEVDWEFVAKQTGMTRETLERLKKGEDPLSSQIDLKAYEPFQVRVANYLLKKISTVVDIPDQLTRANSERQQRLTLAHAYDILDSRLCSRTKELEEKLSLARRRQDDIVKKRTEKNGELSGIRSSIGAMEERLQELDTQIEDARSHLKKIYDVSLSDTTRSREVEKDTLEVELSIMYQREDETDHYLGTLQTQEHAYGARIEAITNQMSDVRCAHQDVKHVKDQVQDKLSLEELTCDSKEVQGILHDASVLVSNSWREDARMYDTLIAEDSQTTYKTERKTSEQRKYAAQYKDHRKNKLDQRRLRYEEKTSA